MPDTVMEHARDVTIKLHHRIGKYVQVHLYFALRWIMLSEVTFVSSKYFSLHFLVRFSVGVKYKFQRRKEGQINQNDCVKKFTNLKYAFVTRDGVNQLYLNFQF